MVLNNDLTKKCIKMFHKNWVSQEGFFIQIELLYGYVRQHVFFLTNMHNTTTVNIYFTIDGCY